jgi:hypothetical protein
MQGLADNLLLKHYIIRDAFWKSEKENTYHIRLDVLKVPSLWWAAIVGEVAIRRKEAGANRKQGQSQESTYKWGVEKDRARLEWKDRASKRPWTRWARVIPES